MSFDHWQESHEKVAKDVPVLSLEITAIKAEYRKQTWDDIATVTVAKISILNHLIKGKLLCYHGMHYVCSDWLKCYPRCPWITAHK